MISRIDKLRIINALREFEAICEAKNIKFNKFTSEELMEILMLYKAYRLCDEPPF